MATAKSTVPGVHPHTPNPKQRHTVAELLAYYRREILPSKAPTTRYTAECLYRRILHDFGPVDLTALTPERLRQWRDTLSTEYSPGTVRRFVDTFSGLLTAAVRDFDWLDVNPLRKVRKPPETPGRERCLTPDERDKLLAACQQSRSKALYLFTVLALATGCRKRELLDLTWADVDLEQHVLRLRRTKNGTRRILPVTGLAVALLQAHAAQRGREPLVFPGEGALGRPINLDHQFREAVKRAGLHDLHPHDLRHTFASYLIMSGASLVEAAALLGHKQLKMVQRYSHLSTSHLTTVAAKMTTAFLGA